MTADHDYEESETSPKVYSDPIQLISPRKPPNPAKQNPDLRELQRELKFNNKMYCTLTYISVNLAVH